MSMLASLRRLSTDDSGAITVGAVVLTATIFGLGAAGYTVMNTDASPRFLTVDTQPGTYQGGTGMSDTSEPAASEQGGASRVCTPNGGHCAYDRDGDGMVDELRNYSRGKTLDVEGNGITMQGYADSGWS